MVNFSYIISYLLWMVKNNFSFNVLRCYRFLQQIWYEYWIETIEIEYTKHFLFRIFIPHDLKKKSVYLQISTRKSFGQLVLKLIKRDLLWTIWIMFVREYNFNISKLYMNNFSFLYKQLGYLYTLFSASLLFTKGII